MSTGQETCENCGRAIGKLETPMVFKSHVVCAKCHEALAGQAAREFVAEAAERNDIPKTVDLRAKYKTPPCPVCGAGIGPMRKAKGSTVLFILLLCIGILPGLIYGIFCQGDMYVCPICGAKRGDAT